MVALELIVVEILAVATELVAASPALAPCLLSPAAAVVYASPCTQAVGLQERPHSQGTAGVEAIIRAAAPTVEREGATFSVLRPLPDMALSRRLDTVQAVVEAGRQVILRTAAAASQVSVLWSGRHEVIRTDR